jgi:competence protein ComGC
MSFSMKTSFYKKPEFILVILFIVILILIFATKILAIKPNNKNDQKELKTTGKYFNARSNY